MKNILYSLALLVSFSSFGQTIKSGDWEYYDDYLGGWLIVNKSPICIKNCNWLTDHKPAFAFENHKFTTKGVMFQINGPFYSDYDGSDIEIEIKVKYEDNTYSPTLGVFKSYNNTNSDGTDSGITQLDVFENLSISLNTQGILKLISNAKELFIQTRLNGEVRVIKYNLYGFSKIYSVYEQLYYNPFVD